MSARKVLEFPTTQSSKLEEKQFIGKLSSAAREAGQSYLASLLSPQLIEWFCEQVSNDFDCNLAAQYVELSREYTELERVTSEARRAYDFQVKELTEKLKACEAARMQLADALVEVKNELAEDRQAFEESRERLITHIDNARTERDQLKKQIVELKAELYDLMKIAEAAGAA